MNKIKKYIIVLLILAALAANTVGLLYILHDQDKKKDSHSMVIYV